jgi:hypothetical protein
MLHLKPKTAWANFINSCLEQFAKTLKKKANIPFSQNPKEIQVIMSILSNYVPNCIVRAEVSCPIAEIYKKNILKIRSTLLNVSFKQFKLPSRTFRAVTQ